MNDIEVKMQSERHKIEKRQYRNQICSSATKLQM